MGPHTGRFAHLPPGQADPLLAIMRAFAADPRANKIDLGVGVYKDESGATRVLRSVKTAEQQLWTEQQSKGYLGAEGDRRFTDLVRSLAFSSDALVDRIASLQTVGGTGALRLCFDLLALGNAQKIKIGNPSWANHVPLLEGAGLEPEIFQYFDCATQSICFEFLLDAAESCEQGQAMLLQVGCHNPTGAELSYGQWAALFDALSSRGAIPVLDFAYHGLATNLDQDAVPLRQATEKCEEFLVTYSCDKNFGLYRERTGALFVVCASSASRDRVQSNLLSLARANWSMPPDHGAAVVRTILDDEALTMLWQREVANMAARINQIRKSLADAHPAFAHLAVQKGMLSLFDLTPGQIQQLRLRHAIYMVDTGRANLCGLNEVTLPSFVEALVDVGLTTAARSGD